MIDQKIANRYKSEPLAQVLLILQTSEMFREYTMHRLVTEINHAIKNVDKYDFNDPKMVY